MSSNIQGLRRRYSSNGRSQATDESSSGESSLSEETGSRTEEEKSTQIMELENTDDEAAERQDDSSAKQDTTEGMKGYLNKDYRDLLNEVIEEAAGTSHPESEELYPSYVGSSYWEVEEKEAIFRTLAIKGRDDLPGLSRGIRTKSQIEVRSYLLALENACSNGQVTSPDSGSATPNTPAAYEIGEHCEHAISLTAEVLERQVLRRDIQREKRKYGNLWLIDDDLSAKIELHQQEKSLATAMDDAQKATDSSDHGSAESGSENDVVESESDPDKDGSEEVLKVDTITSADLLKPEVFLQLSRSLFMNSATDSASNWSQIASEVDDLNTPAILRSAFDNLNTIAINFTRWIVQATMFQATSRLRAKDDQEPTPVVTTEDVRTAIDFLNLKLDRKKYWAGVAKRCGVEVYSDADKYRDGRPSTRNGRCLTYDEVGIEFGFPPSDLSRASKSDGIEVEEESSPSISSSESSEGRGQSDVDSEVEGEEDMDVSSSNSTEVASKRKRANGLSSDDDEQDQRLDAADENASRAEERRLMKMLRYRVSPSPDVEAQKNKDGDGSSRRKRARTEQQSNWRSQIEYVAPWEQQRIAMELEGVEGTEE